MGGGLVGDIPFNGDTTLALTTSDRGLLSGGGTPTAWHLHAPPTPAVTTQREKQPKTGASTLEKGAFARLSKGDVWSRVLDDWGADGRPNGQTAQGHSNGWGGVAP